MQQLVYITCEKLNVNQAAENSLLFVCCAMGSAH